MNAGPFWCETVVPNSFTVREKEIKEYSPCFQLVGTWKGLITCLGPHSHYFVDLAERANQSLYEDSKIERILIRLD